MAQTDAQIVARLGGLLQILEAVRSEAVAVGAEGGDVADLLALFLFRGADGR